jgi:hypothetical protein
MARKDDLARGRGLARDDHARRVMMPREAPPLFAPRDLSASFRPFSFLFPLWTPLCPFLLFYSYLAICNNPIFTHGIFSGVGTQIETARTEPA